MKVVSGPRVLVVGVYLLNKPSNATQVTRALLASADWETTVMWTALGPGAVPAALEPYTAKHMTTLVERFTALNSLLHAADFTGFDAVVCVDDDIEISEKWLDAYLAQQIASGLDLAQAARTSDSYIDHPFVTQMAGIDSRETRFVEIGPVVSLLPSAYAAILPFDETFQMGWGADAVWPLAIESAGLKMGVIDVAPVRHRIRRPQSTYNAGKARERLQADLVGRAHVPTSEGQVIKASTVAGRTLRYRSCVGPRPRMSVVLATRNRSEYLRVALAGMVAQTLDPAEFEVIVVDDGSTDETPAVSAAFESLLPLTYLFQKPTGIGAARNHGLLTSHGDCVLFLDDDDVADSRLLEAHLLAHDRYPDPRFGILGFTGLDGRTSKSLLMQYVVGSGGQLFSYDKLHPYVPLDFMHFWGGRSSAKREYLLRHGIFDEQFTFGAEDLELGLRLTHFGFEIIYEPRAVSWMRRTLIVEEFLERARRQGRSYKALEQKHASDSVTKKLGLSQALAQSRCLLEHRCELAEQARSLLALAQEQRDAGMPPARTAFSRIGAVIDAAYWASMVEGFLSEPETQHRDGERVFAHAPAKSIWTE